MLVVVMVVNTVMASAMTSLRDDKLACQFVPTKPVFGGPGQPPPRAPTRA